MDAITLDAIVTELGTSLESTEHLENTPVLVEEFNGLLDEARQVFPDESYIQKFRPVDLPAAGAEPTDETLKMLLEKLKMKLALLKAYVTTQVAKEKQKTHVY